MYKISKYNTEYIQIKFYLVLYYIKYDYVGT